MPINHQAGQGDEGRTISKKNGWLGSLILVGLGTMLFLLPGCGSDSTPKGAASGKKEKAAKSGDAVRTITPLLSNKEGGTSPELPQLDKFPGTASSEEIEAKRKAGIAAMENPKLEVMPGLTQEQLAAKLEAERAKKPNPRQEILPGLSLEQLDAKLREERASKRTTAEIVPGLTEAQAQARAAQAKQLQDAQGAPRPEQVVPPK